MSHYYFNSLPHGVRKNGQKLNAKTHFDYIYRENEYAHIKDREEDLVYKTSGNLPPWAENPGEFWKKAEKNKADVNSRLYREMRIGLQEELTLEENIELIEKLIEETGIKDHHVYSYAIHDKTAAFDKDHRNIHVHLMFNEKVIEKDRPLGPELFFKDYHQYKGQPTAKAGYRTSKYFSSEQTTIDLRKRWAELCNEKFKEKGIDKTITEKSLKDQKEDLLSQGRTEEAKLVDREAAPHLGKAYRNEKTMERIQEHIRKYDQITDQEAPIPEETISIDGKTEMEQKIMMFAMDAVIRRTAKEIQEERIRLQKEQQAEQIMKEAEEIKEDPLVISVGDLDNYCMHKVISFTAEAEEKLSLYKHLKIKEISEENLHKTALDKAFSGNYEKARKNYAATAKKLATEKARYDQLLHGTAGATERLAALQKIKELQEKKNSLGKEINNYKTLAAGSMKDKVEKIRAELQQQNNSLEAERKKLYTEYRTSKTNAENYQKVIEKLKDENKDMILFEERLPKQLTRGAKIDGQKPLYKMPMASSNEGNFIIISQPAKEGPQDDQIKAVKLGDDIIKGQVHIYVLTKGEKGRYTAKKTEETATLYKKRERQVGNKVNHTQGKPAGTKTSNNTITPGPIQEAINYQNQNITHKLNQLADSIINPGHEATFNVHWNDQDHDYSKNEAERVAKELDQGIGL